jgi:BirA family transcriptional regulator, biotin operon repressor / biotin---[acetyl-CoA-carboxylase] ligase
VSNIPHFPPLNAVALRKALAPPWRHLEVVDETGSTNSDLLARVAAGENIGGTVLVAEHQTAGRGRNGRSWQAAAHAQITMSAAVSAEGVPARNWGWLSLAAGVAIVDTVTALTDADVGLKWPNDVLAGDGKLAGILAEVAPSTSVIVIGIGLNVAGAPEGLTGLPAVSLTDLGVSAPDRNDLVHRLLGELGCRINSWRVAGGADHRLMADYRDRCATIGEQVRAILPGGREIVGTARSIDAQGRLIIESDGATSEVSAGDLVHLRH